MSHGCGNNAFMLLNGPVYSPTLKTGVPGIPVFRFRENLVIQRICFTNTSTQSKEICDYKQSFAYLHGFFSCVLCTLIYVYKVEIGKSYFNVTKFLLEMKCL